MELCRTIARNTAADSENRMHDNATAAAYGFRGGLVPGVTVYGYMAAPLGNQFLARGGMRLRLLAPFYDGDEVVVDLTDERVVEARNAAGRVCASGVLGEVASQVVDVPEAALPETRPWASAESLVPGRVLGTLRHALEEVKAESLLNLSNRVLMANVRLNPWIHASSEIQHFSPAASGEELAVRAKVAANFERGGHRFVTLDIVILSAGGRLIQAVKHTAIYAPKQRA
jgi:acyl dehydratase